MKLYRTFLNSILIMLAITIFANPAAAYTKPWSDWYQIKDEALNGIWFSWKCSEGQCDWRWDNRYTTEVKIRFSLRHMDAGGDQKIVTGEQRLTTGTNESARFVLATRELKGVEVEILEPKYTGPRSTKYVPSSTAEVDAEKKRMEEEKYARQQEELRQQQIAQERARRQSVEREERRQEQARRDNEDFNNTLKAGLQSFQNSINQGVQSQVNANRIIADAQEAQRRQNDENTRYQLEQQQIAEENRRREGQRIVEENKRRENLRLAQLEQDRRDEEARKRKEEERRKEEIRKAEERKNTEAEAIRLKGFEVIGTDIDYGDTRDQCCDALFGHPKWRLFGTLVPICEAKGGLMKNEKDDELLKFAGYCTPQKNNDGGYKVKCTVPVTGTCILKK